MSSSTVFLYLYDSGTSQVFWLLERRYQSLCSTNTTTNRPSHTRAFSCYYIKHISHSASLEKCYTSMIFYALEPHNFKERAQCKALELLYIADNVRNMIGYWDICLCKNIWKVKINFDKSLVWLSHMSWSPVVQQAWPENTWECSHNRCRVIIPVIIRPQPDTSSDEKQVLSQGHCLQTTQRRVERVWRTGKWSPPMFC